MYHFPVLRDTAHRTVLQHDLEGLAACDSLRKQARVWFLFCQCQFSLRRSLRKDPEATPRHSRKCGLIYHGAGVENGGQQARNNHVSH